MRKIFFLLFLICPCALGAASTFIGLLRNHPAADIFYNALGIVGLYYFIISIFVYIKWNSLNQKINPWHGNEYFLQREVIHYPPYQSRRRCPIHHISEIFIHSRF